MQAQLYYLSLRIIYVTYKPTYHWKRDTNPYNKMSKRKQYSSGLPQAAPENEWDDIMLSGKM